MRSCGKVAAKVQECNDLLDAPSDRQEHPYLFWAEDSEAAIGI